MLPLLAQITESLNGLSEDNLALVLETINRLKDRAKESKSNCEIKTLDCMSKEELDEMLEEGWKQAKLGLGLDLDEAFAEISRDIG